MKQIMRIKEDENMTKKFKKFIAGLLTASMVAAVAVPVFADSEKQEVKLTGTYEVSGNSTTYETDINITIPTKTLAIVNPYAVSIEDSELLKNVLEKIGVTETTVSAASIIAPVLTVENNSEIPVNISVQDFMVSANGIKIAGSSVAGKKNTEKSAYVYLQVAKESGKKYIGEWQKVGTKDEKGKIKYTANSKFPKTALKNDIWEVKAKDAKKGKGAALKNAFDIPAKSGDKPGVAYLHIMGDVNSNPINKSDKSSNPWTASDQLYITYKLVFNGTANVTGK
jgi:hypothetical protein